MIVDIEFDKAASVRAAIAVEFLDEKIRFLQLQKSGTKSEIKSFAEVKLAPGDVVGGVVKNPTVVGIKLAKAIEDARPRKPSTEYVICLVPQKEMFLTVLDLPAVDKDGLRDILVRKVTDIIPMDEAEVYWDWHRIQTLQNKTRVQLAAVPKMLIDSYMQTLEVAKLIPLLFEPSTTAASRVIFPLESSELQKKSTKPVIFLEIRDTYGVVSLQQQGGIVFATDISLKSDSMAEKVIVLEQKINELGKYAKTHLKLGEDAENIKVSVYGDTSQITKVLPLLQERSQHAINLIEPKYESPSVVQFVKKLGDNSIFPVLGAATRGIAHYSEEATLNLIPQKAKLAFRKKETYKVLRDYLMFIAVNTVFLVFMLLVVAFQVRATQSDLDAKYQSILAISNSPIVNKIEKNVDELNSQTGELNSLISGIYNWQEFLTLLNTTTPSDVQLTSATATPRINLSGGGKSKWTVTIAGSSSDRASTIRFINNLRASSLLENVKLPVASLEEEFDANFIIEAEMPFERLTENEI